MGASPGVRLAPIDGDWCLSRKSSKRYLRIKSTKCLIIISGPALTGDIALHVCFDLGVRAERTPGAHGFLELELFDARI
jgi:hypothetical protein